MRIRSLRHRDSKDVLRINASAGAAVSALDLPELTRLMTISTLHLAVVHADGAIAGYLLAFSKEQAYDGQEFLALGSSIAEPFVYIDQIVIESSVRGTGAGRMLYRELASRACSLGAATLCCEVNISPPNPRSLGFHRHMGFMQIGQLDTADGRTVALLRWDI